MLAFIHVCDAVADMKDAVDRVDCVDRDARFLLSA